MHTVLHIVIQTSFKQQQTFPSTYDTCSYILGQVHIVTYEWCSRSSNVEPRKNFFDVEERREVEKRGHYFVKPSPHRLKISTNKTTNAPLFKLLLPCNFFSRTCKFARISLRGLPCNLQHLI